MSEIQTNWQSNPQAILKAHCLVMREVSEWVLGITRFFYLMELEQAI